MAGAEALVISTVSCEREISYLLTISEFPLAPLTRGPRESIVVGCGARGAEGHAPCKDV